MNGQFEIVSCCVIFGIVFMVFAIVSIKAFFVLKKKPEEMKLEKTVEEMFAKRKLYLDLSLLTKSANILMSVCGVISNFYVIYLAGNSKEGVFIFSVISIVVTVILLAWNPGRKSLAYRKAFIVIDDLINDLGAEESSVALKISEAYKSCERILDDTF